MPMPLLIVPTTTLSPADGDARCTEWPTLFLGLALGCAFTLVLLFAGACGGCIAYCYRASRHKAKGLEPVPLRRGPSTYIDLISGERRVASPVPDPRPSTATMPRFDPFARTPAGDADGEPVGNENTERVVLASGVGHRTGAVSTTSAAGRSVRNFLERVRNAEEARRERVVGEMCHRPEFALPLEEGQLEVRVDKSVANASRSTYERP